MSGRRQAAAACPPLAACPPPAARPSPAPLDRCSIRSNENRLACRIRLVPRAPSVSSASAARRMFGRIERLRGWGCLGLSREPRSPRSRPRAFSRIEFLHAASMGRGTAARRRTAAGMGPA